ncbi:MAG TPA: hypothetical protein VIX13_02235, partial [Candidatus Eisenbacteria bacterium]
MGMERELTILRATMISAYLTAVIPALVFPWLLLQLRNTGLFAIFPVLPAAVVYARLIRARRTDAAVTVAMLWALALTISTVAASAAFSEAASKSIWHAGAFRDEML